MNEQGKNEQNEANPQNTQNVIKSLISKSIKRETKIIKQGGCGCGKRSQL
ncbi:hypothetical protein ABE288_18430 [Bacillus salipaludis]